MNNYICKIATIEEINKKCDYEINRHPENTLWINAKQNQIRGFNNNSRIVYIGILDKEIICEATAIIKEEGFIGETNNYKELISDKRVYLSAFRTNKEYENKGYFSKLFQFMEADLKNRGYRELCLGVEPCEVRNIQIYFKLGFTNYIKTEIEQLTEKTEVVNYYLKKIE